jgi:hypothetical protein
MNLAFRNPANGYIEESPLPWLWCLIFGGFYFAYKHVYMHSIIALVLAIFTGGFSWFIYPFFANKIIKHSYLQRGWQQVDAGESAPDPMMHRTGNTLVSQRPVYFLTYLGCIIGIIVVLGIIVKLVAPAQSVPSTQPVQSSSASTLPVPSSSAPYVDQSFNERQAAKRAAMKAHSSN